jgi:hypothetical protein
MSKASEPGVSDPTGTLTACSDCGETAECEYSSEYKGYFCENCWARYDRETAREWESGDFEDFDELAEDHGGRLE